MSFKTTDLCDEYEDEVQIAEPVFRDLGGVRAFGGEIVTVKVHEDNVLVRGILETKGEGRVLVVDGGGSNACALIGDQVAQIACDNGWAGIVVNGYIRDSADVAKIGVGLKALGVLPKRSRKEGKGVQDVIVFFAGLVFSPGMYLYADEDGILIVNRDLLNA
jgi:regulator of ribonuclease activity A